MSFMSKVKENQRFIYAVIAGIAAGSILFRLIRGRPKQETPEQRRRRQIQALRRTINTQNPSFEDIRKVLQYSIHEAKMKVAAFSKAFKQKRMKYTNITRKQNLNQYLSLVYEGLNQMQNIAIRQQQQLMRDLGISQFHMKKYQKLLEVAIQQMLHIQKNDISHIKPMKVEEVKFALRRQAQFIKKEGLQYAQLIIDATREWPIEKKAALPVLLSTVITDGAYEGYPQLDNDAIQHAEAQYQRQILGQLQQIQVAITPMMIKLGTALKGHSQRQVPHFYQQGTGSGFDFQQMNKLNEFQRMKMGQPPLFYK